MQLDTITMDRTDARQAYLEYRDAVRARHTAEDAAIARGYRMLSLGRQLIRLSTTITAGGLNDQGLPALAVGRADRDAAWLTTTRDGTVTYHHDDPWETAHNAGVAAGTIRLPEVLPDVTPTSRFNHYRARVPHIPPGLRPDHALSGYHILWEVERWEKAPRPDRDPALLKHLGGDLYAVLAIWDLTDLERAVLAGRTV